MGEEDQMPARGALAGTPDKPAKHRRFSRMRIRFFVVASLLAMAIVGISSAPALAAEGGHDLAKCTFTGTTDQLTPVPLVGNPVPPLLPNYHFKGDGTCTVSHPGTLGENGVVKIHIESGGTYNNIVCGTGTADGTATVTYTSTVAGDNVSGEFPVNLTYTLQFASGAGTLIITGGGHADGTGNATGGGAVDITPTNNTPPNDVGCVNAPANGFNVVSDATVVLPDA